MGGDLKKIQTVGAYFVEIWKAVGMEGIGDKVLSPFAIQQHSFQDPLAARLHICILIHLTDLWTPSKSLFGD